MDRVMVDIETLSTQPDAAVFSIGAVRFSPGEVSADTFYESIDLESNFAVDRHVEGETLEWWLNQPEAAREEITGGIVLPQALKKFSAWYGDADEVWACPPAFDCVILEGAFDAVYLPAPWEHGDRRDLRTLGKLPQAVESGETGTEHHALDDAVNQAKDAAATLKELGVVEEP
jgi:hypothetical protein